jgi:DNA (cytosine-5)-methyltransferase 1
MSKLLTSKQMMMPVPHAHVDVAINHDSIALAVHAMNHPDTKHLVCSVWDAKPKVVAGGQHVGFLWASPDCTHFSVAKGGKPKKQGIRSLAYVVVEWAREVRPDVIMVENVAEFLGWGPLDAKNQPIKARMGETFNTWRGRLELLGYTVDYRILDASLYGAPTSRRRMFLIARCDGKNIVWPEPTHGPGKLPFHTAAECIDWSLPSTSIFARCECAGRKSKKGLCKACGLRRGPLAEKTEWRIAMGLKKFVLESAKPFVLKVNHGGLEDRSESLERPLSTVTAAQRGHAVVTPILVNTRNGERKGQDARVFDVREPMRTVTAKGSQGAVVTAFLNKHFGGNAKAGDVCRSLEEPISTVTARDHHSVTAATLVKMRGDNHGAELDAPAPTITAGGTHVGLVRAFLVKYFGTAVGQDLNEPAHTITAKARLGLVTIYGEDYQIVDIQFRMLEPEELLRAQFGKFAASYDLSLAKTKSKKVRLIGNSVCPEVVEALVAANVVGLTGMKVDLFAGGGGATVGTEAGFKAAQMARAA